MANEQNLVSLATRSERERKEIARKGQIASTKARKEKATMLSTLRMLLDEKAPNGKTYRELATLGLIKGAIKGNPVNFKTMIEVLGEPKGTDTTNGILGELVEAMKNAKDDK